MKFKFYSAPRKIVLVIFVLSSLFLVFPTFLFCQIWTSFNNNLTDSTILTISSMENQIIVNTDSKGLYKSDIYSAQWESANNGLDISKFTMLSLSSDNNNFFATTSRNLFISKDFGGNWQIINENVELFNSYTPFTSLSSFSTKILYTKSGLIYFSENNGNDWNLIASGNKYKLISCSFMNEFAFVIGTLQGNILVSSNNGKSWDSIATLPASINSVVLDGKTIYAATENGFFFNNENNEWYNKNDGLNSLNIKAIILTSKFIIIGTNDGIFYSEKGTITKWNSLNNGLYNTKISGLSLINNLLFASTFGSGFFKLDISFLSIKEQNNNFIVYPNPATEYIKINLRNNTQTDIFESSNIEILDIFGNRIISTSSLYASSQEGNWEIDVSGLLPGVYFLKINNQPPVKFIKI